MKKHFALLLGFLPLAASFGVKTHSVSHTTFEDFVSGEFENVSVSHDGRLNLSSTVEEVAAIDEPIVWAAVADADGNLYLGTGNAGKVVKVARDGEVSTVFSPEEILSRALAVDADGNLYVGTSPIGRVYRIPPEGRPEIYFDPEDTYIWDLTIDPDGNPDTSFLARIPADVAWTFQTLDKDGLVLNMAQTWHQLRPGEIRHNCGGCHAHSQQPTRFEDTYAARPEYEIFDLTRTYPLLTDKQRDESGTQWDVNDTTGLRYAKDVLNVEYHRDIRPIFERSCVACHSRETATPAGELVLDDDRRLQDHVGTATYHRLVYPSGSRTRRYVWPSQSRNSLLTWKVFGRRMDGFPAEMVAGAEGDYAGHLARGGSPYEAFKGSIMPPRDAVAGTYKGPDGKPIKVAPLTDEDRRTLVRWIDLGCPIDHDYDPQHPDRRGRGWMLDDQRPTLTLTHPQAGVNKPLTRIVLGMHDFGTGLDMDAFQLTADFPVAGIAAGDNLASLVESESDGVWELQLPRPIANLPRARMTVTIKDLQGNTTRIERTLSVGK